MGYIPKKIAGFYFPFLLMVLLLGRAGFACAQPSPARTVSDSGWYQSYDTGITTRLYFSQKYLSMVISEGKNAPKLKYRPNSNLAIGLGATYGWFTLNVSYAFDFLNPGDKSKGTSKAIDLQTHFYGPKLTVDLYGQLYNGFYLYPEGTAAAADNWYIRPDIDLLKVGLAGYYILNWRRFSYRSSFLQNEWQTRSAGTVLLGVEIFYDRSKGDSAFVPSALSHKYNSKEINSTKSFDFGPGAGYAYTLVIARNWFATAALTGNISVDWLTEGSIDSSSSSHFSVRPNYSYKAAVGYNSSRFTTSITWVNNTVRSKGDLASYDFWAGNARMHFAYRFNAGQKFKKKMKVFQATLF